MREKEIKIIIDTDVDFDDLAAILWLKTQKDVDIIGLTTVGTGWTHIHCSTQILLDFMQFIGFGSMPIYKGETKPLIEGRYIPDQDRFEVDCLWGIPLVRSKNKVQGNAVDFIINSCHQYAGQLVILAIGPLTNIAKALKKDPTIGQKISRIIMMGGAPVDSFQKSHFPGNARLDLLATKIVYYQDIPIYAVPPRLAHDFPVDRPLSELFLSLSANPTACFFGEMIKRILERCEEKKINKHLYYWDVVAAMVLKEFHHISAETIHVTVNEEENSECDTIVVDPNGAPINVVTDLNVGEITRRFVDRLKKL